MPISAQFHLGNQPAMAHGKGSQAILSALRFRMGGVTPPPF